MTIKRNLIVNVGTGSNLKFACDWDEEGDVYVQLDGSYAGVAVTTCMQLNQQEVFALREGLTAILDAIRDNAAGR